MLVIQTLGNTHIIISYAYSQIAIIKRLCQLTQFNIVVVDDDKLVPVWSGVLVVES